MSVSVARNARAGRRSEAFMNDSTAEEWSVWRRERASEVAVTL